VFKFIKDVRELKEHAGFDVSINTGIAKQIEKRIGNYLPFVDTFIVETGYIDREWREEFSLYYSLSFYQDINKFTTRIHLIRGEIRSLDENNNIGEKNQNH